LISSGLFRNCGRSNIYRSYHDAAISGGFREKGGRWGRPPPLAHICIQKAAFFRVKAYISLCAFAINEDGADKLSSASPPFQNVWIRHWQRSDNWAFSVQTCVGSTRALKCTSFECVDLYTPFSSYYFVVTYYRQWEMDMRKTCDNHIAYSMRDPICDVKYCALPATLRY